MSLYRTARAAALPLVLLLAVSACDDDGTGPLLEADVAGSYEATVLNTTSGGQTVDQLQAGTELTLDLEADGSTSGRLFVPEGAEGGLDLLADLGGSWSYDGVTGTVTLDHPADTFLRDMVFEVEREDDEVVLRGEETFGDTTVEVVLEPR